jgi:uncharacterized membrane protein YgdD (TMEM256/DUF423 family)
MNGWMWLRIGAISGFLAVAAGAFGAHGLEGKLEPRRLANFGTAATYQMYHALALSGERWLGMITPIGGLAFLVGWAALAVAARGAGPGGP